MSETLQGVLVGGVIASLAPVITLLVETRRWRIEMRVAQLRLTRERLEKLFSEITKALLDGVETGVYPIEMYANMDLHLPQGVRDALDKFLTETDKSKKTMRGHYMFIELEMKKALARIDKEIDDLTAKGIFAWRCSKSVGV